MSKTLKLSIRRPITPYVIVLGSWLLYGAFGLFTPAGTTPHTNYHLPFGVLNAIRISILIPILFFWFLAVYGAQSFTHYSELVVHSPEAKPLRYVSIGLYLTLAYFVVGAVFGSLLDFYTTSPGFPALVILHDHLSEVITLVAFGFFFFGTKSLAIPTQNRPPIRSTAITIIVTTLLAAGFAARFTTETVSKSAAFGSSLAYEPRILLLITLILPYFVAWTLGALSVRNIYTYSRKVNGILYRKALTDLARGLILVIGFSAVGGILMLMSQTTALLGLGPILLLLYLLLLLYGAGYVLSNEI